MADDQVEADQETGDEEIVTFTRSEIRSMESKAKAHGTLQRELAFVKAGVDYESGLGSLLFDSFKGEPTAEAVKAYAIEKGVMETPTPDDETPAEPGSQERDDSRLRRAAATGADIGDQDEHPSAKALSVAEKVMETRPRMDAMAAAIATKANAAMNGDKRALVQGR